MTPERLNELRRIAEGAATRARWSAPTNGVGILSGATWVVQNVEVAIPQVSDAAHIAAFDPPTAIELLDEIERLRADIGFTDLKERLRRDDHRLAATPILAPHDGTGAIE